MGSVISTGIGSGLDVQGLVAQLVAVEGQPHTVRLDREEAKLQSKLSAIGTLNSALSDFRSALSELKELDSFRGRKTTLSSTEYLSAMASIASVPGAYEIEVERLAAAHRLASAAVASADEVIGTGTLTLVASGTIVSAVIDDTNNTLAGIRDAINDAPGNSVITATIINGIDGARLIFSSRETGLANEMVVTASGGDGGLDALVYDPAKSITNLTEIQAAQDARILLDGFAVESATNSVNDAIDGLDIALLAANEIGDTTSVSVGFDRDAARETIGKLIESYNALIDSVTTLSSFDTETLTAGPLFGDAGLRNVAFQLRRELNAVVTTPDSPFSMLVDIGISADFDGKLSLDGAKLDAAFDQDFDAVSVLFAEPDVGIAQRLDSLLEPYLQPGGILDGRKNGLNASIDDINDRREALSRRLEAVEERLFRQFNALDTLLAELQGTSNFLTRQLDNLPGVVLFGRDT